MIYIISDSHFNHKAIKTKFEFRPNNYEDQICRKIKNNVKDTDTLIHLWDVIFDRPSELDWYLNRMWWCTKILVKWNHDKSNDSFYYNKGFNLVVDELKIWNIVLTHIPKQDLLEWEINIHWHCHVSNRDKYDYESLSDIWMYSLYSPIENNFMPILLNKLIRDAKEKKYI